jgi:microcystin-dependent protein
MSTAIIRFRSTPGASFAARLIDTSGQQVGNDITDDFIENAPGWYSWQANGAVPTTFEGEVRIVRVSDGVIIRRVPIGGNAVAYAPPAHAHSTAEVSGLMAALAEKVDSGDERLSDARTPTAHTHSIANVTNLQSSLNAKSDASHTHEASGITLAQVYPVGSIYISVVNTNPATVFGFGTWVSFGAGRCLVGVDVGQSEFDAVEKTGGSKTHTLITSEMPSHTHTQDSHNHTQNAHGHTEQAQGGTTANTGGTHLMTSTATGGSLRSSGQSTVNATATNQAATAVNQSTGGGAAHNNLQPFITAYFFKRTA